MKKVLLLIIAVVSITRAYAQNADSLQVQSTISIDSLSVRLDKLQHDYNYLYCDHELSKLMLDLKDFSHTVDIASHRLISDFYMGEFNSIVYSKSLENYNANSILLESTKRKIEAVKISVAAKMVTSNFSEQEQNMIYSGFAVIQTYLTTAESSLSYYDVALQAYNSRRR